VELLVVIGIIAVLISLLLPVVSKARAQANRTACQSNVRQLYVGILNYCNDNHDWYPTCAQPADETAYIEYPDDWLYWQADRNLDDSPLAKYLHVRGEALKSLLRCPVDTFDDRKPFSTLPVARRISQGPYLYSYAIAEGVGQNVPSPPQPLLRTKRSQWHRPGEKVLLTEGFNQQPNFYAGPAIDWGDPLTRHHGSGVSKSTHKPIGINVTAGFMDGHISAIDEDFAANKRNFDLP
jgi:hypothetical protein